MMNEKMEWADVAKLFQLAKEALAPSKYDAYAFGRAVKWAKKKSKADPKAQVTKDEVVEQLTKMMESAKEELDEMEKRWPEMLDCMSGPHTKHQDVIWWGTVSSSFLVYGDHWGKDSLEFLENLGDTW